MRYFFPSLIVLENTANGSITVEIHRINMIRVDDKTGHWSKIYRGKQSLESLIATFDGSTGEEIKTRLRSSKSTDTGSCSESCEVFSCEI